MDQAVFVKQVEKESGLFGWIDEITSTHPNLPRRIYELEQFFERSEINAPQAEERSLLS